MDWGACLAAHETWLRKVIAVRTGEPQAVDEVFQQVALAAVEQRAPLADAGKAAPWLHRLAVVHSARYRRKQGRQRRAMRTVGEQLPHLGNGYAADALTWLVNQERHERRNQ
jgi:RNA polymerase sigma-70 factor (ECF subfamily)